jgi:hypothetical protein
MIAVVIALGLCGCISQQPVAGGSLSSKVAPTPKEDELLVKLAPANIQRRGQFKIQYDSNGNPKFEEPKMESLVKGEVTVGSEKVAVYLPANGPYALTSEKSHSFENTSTPLSIDSDNNGELSEAEEWFASMPIRLGDQMFDVKEIDPGAQWMLLARSSMPLGGVVLGKPCPNFEFKTMDGKSVSLADYKGKALLLDVWSMT